MPAFKMNQPQSTFALIVNDKPFETDEVDLSQTDLETCLRWAGNFDVTLHRVLISENGGLTLTPAAWRERLFKEQQAQQHHVAAPEAIPTPARAPMAPKIDETLPAVEIKEKAYAVAVAMIRMMRSMQETPGINEAESRYIDGVIDTMLSQLGQSENLEHRLRLLQDRMAAMGWQRPPVDPALIQDATKIGVYLRETAGSSTGEDADEARRLTVAEQYKLLWDRLGAMLDTDGETDQADELRDAMDKIWYRLSDEERELYQGATAEKRRLGRAASEGTESSAAGSSAGPDAGSAQDSAAGSSAGPDASSAQDSSAGSSAGLDAGSAQNSTAGRAKYVGRCDRCGLKTRAKSDIGRVCGATMGADLKPLPKRCKGHFGPL